MRKCHLTRQFHLARNRLSECRSLPVLHKVFHRDACIVEVFLANETEAALLLPCYKIEQAGKRFERGTKRRNFANYETIEETVCLRGKVVDAIVCQNPVDQPVERAAPKPSVQPMTALPVAAIAPDSRGFGKLREGPRIPCPQPDPVRWNHPGTVNSRDRICGRP